jgi:hypothetical protein
VALEVSFSWAACHWPFLASPRSPSSMHLFVQDKSGSEVGWARTLLTRIYGVHTVFKAGKSPYMRSYTVCIYGSGQP